MTRISLRTLLIAVTILCGPAWASAHSAQSSDMAVGHIWAYPTVTAAGQTSFFMKGMPQGNTVDVFGPFLNGGDTADALTGVTSPAASAVNIVYWFQGNQMTRDLPLELPSDQPVALDPQTQFLRFYGVHGTFKPGDKFPLTFHFRHAPDVTINAPVQAR